MPVNSLKILDGEVRTGRGPVFLQDFESIIIYKLRTATDQELMALPYMEKGLHNRLRQASLSYTSLDEILEYCTTSRYPRSRIAGFSAHYSRDGRLLSRRIKDNGYAQYIGSCTTKDGKLLASARDHPSHH